MIPKEVRETFYVVSMIFKFSMEIRYIRQVACKKKTKNKKKKQKKKYVNLVFFLSFFKAGKIRTYIL
jgi:hypothetical protein